MFNIVKRARIFWIKLKLIFVSSKTQELISNIHRNLNLIKKPPIFLGTEFIITKALFNRLKENLEVNYTPGFSFFSYKQILIKLNSGFTNSEDLVLDLEKQYNKDLMNYVYLVYSKLNKVETITDLEEYEKLLIFIRDNTLIDSNKILEKQYIKEIIASYKAELTYNLVVTYYKRSPKNIKNFKRIALDCSIYLKQASSTGKYPILNNYLDLELRYNTAFLIYNIVQFKILDDFYKKAKENDFLNFLTPDFEKKYEQSKEARRILEENIIEYSDFLDLS